ncbi:MAG TPA: DoxX family protein [Balneolaceae bacterium]|nr:DoxX family protein [Balneolaceae bacterium]
MGFFLLLARILFSAIFIQSGIGHIMNTAQMGEYAKTKGVPLPQIAVFLTGIMILLGGVSVLLGLWVKVGAWLLILFLVPTAFIMHNFWTVEDPMDRRNDQIHFMKDLALAGAAFLIWFLYVMANVPWSIS